MNNIAIVGVGPVATGEHGRGIPALVSCLETLSRDHAITVYSLLRADPRYVPSGLRVRCLHVRTWSLTLDLVLLAGMILADHFRRRFDALHAIAAFPAGWVCLLLGKILRVPVVVGLLGEEVAKLPSADFGDLRNRSKSRKTEWVCRRASVLTALTKYQAQGLRDLGLPTDRALIVPFGVELARFPFSQKVPSPPFEFLHVAYSHPVKGIDTLLETFRRVTEAIDARLVIVGSGHIGHRTETEIERLDLRRNVELVPPQPNRGLVAFYSRAHFLLHTSLYESQGVVMNEAMASGVLVCATRVGLANDLGGRYCITAEVGDARGLADAILAVVEDTDRYRAMQRSALEWCEAHDVRWTANRYRQIYAQFGG